MLARQDMKYSAEILNVSVELNAVYDLEVGAYQWTSVRLQ